MMGLSTAENTACKAYKHQQSKVSKNPKVGQGNHYTRPWTKSFDIKILTLFSLREQSHALFQ